MGKASRDKGCRGERQVVQILQDAGIGAERIPLSGAAGGSFAGDITCPVRGQDRVLEMKWRANGFKQLYGWLGSNFGLVVKRDRDQPLVVLRLSDFAELARQPNITYSGESAE